MSIFTTSKLNEVFFRIAKFPGDTKHAFIHAPFDRVLIDGHTYCQPRSFSPAQGGLYGVYLYNTATVIDDLETASDRDLFYTELNPIVLEGHELGDYQGRGDDWVGMFKLGLI